MADRQDIFNKLKDIIRKAATHNFKAYTKLDNVRLESVVDFDSLGFDHWIMVLLVKSKVINITFQIHFLSHISRKLAGSGLGLDFAQLNPDICHQFMQEYCNRTIGTIKSHLIESCVKAEDFDLSPAVPERLPSFDEVNLRKALKDNSISDCWAFKFSDGQVTCASRIDIFDFEALKTLTELDLSVFAINKGGEIEFF